MSNNFDITINDFKNICRTCFSKEDLKPLYEKCFPSTCIVEMLMTCTIVKFTEDDGLPAKICVNCINEISHAFSFTKRCETTDTMLRKCLKEFQTELANNSSQSQKVTPIIPVEEEMEIKPENIVSNLHRTKEDNLGHYEYVGVDEIKQEEEEVKIENVECVAEVKQEEELIIDNEYDETKNDPADKNYELDDDEDQDETCSEKSEEPNLDSRRRCKVLLDSLSKTKQLHSCDECGIVFSQLRTLKIHELTHTGEKKNVCSVCSKTFTRPSNLKRHMRIHTGEKPYSCEVCSKTFSDTSNIQNHMRLHTGEKPNVCSVCNKAFTHPTSLKNHLRTHTGEKPHVCGVCSKAFIQPYNLKNHMKIHTGEKSHICPYCSKAFTHSTSMKNHMSIHTGDKSYTCEVCGKTFTHLLSLKRHARIHTGEKSYICGVCSKAFTLPNYLKNHMRTHAGE